jgi:Flp pilus assembly protein TadB
MQAHSHEVCPNCHNAEQTAKVSALYHNSEPSEVDQRDIAGTAIPFAASTSLQQGAYNQRNVSMRRVGAMPVTEWGPQGIAKELAPPVQPNAAVSGPQDVWASGAIAPFGAILFTIVITILFGAATLYWSIPLALIVVIIATFLIVWYRQSAATRAMPLWEKAMERWEEMYYCANCDGVFLPWERVFVPVAQKDALAYQSGALKLDKAK